MKFKDLPIGARFRFTDALALRCPCKKIEANKCLMFSGVMRIRKTDKDEKVELIK